ncbi:hypothetical protein BKA67DRAFT_573721 [Truncatella angustata]|uniref:Cyclochlorotine biosynthesis protein O n=1 Tax=Truncatella angustata TaxID=152316 RepID=A0A9P8ZVV1_9PEZI|nr:uncharacterized protein BKA67DRAFT_573721 [Truncatella angustata]KAH6652380.1 hypothetical protein BKA67DRAFT_573721 [Truncatella angustata]
MTQQAMLNEQRVLLRFQERSPLGEEHQNCECTRSGSGSLQNCPITSKRWLVLHILAAGLCLFGCLFFLSSEKNAPSFRGWEGPEVTYTPARSASFYKQDEFSDEPDPRYHRSPPNPAIDAAWADLYFFGVLAQSQEAAKQSLINRTRELRQNREEANEATRPYYLTLHIFHQLHCLNNLRMLAWPEYYGSLDDMDGEERWEIQQHLAHCIDILRQALLCTSDISTNFWFLSDVNGPEPKVVTNGTSIRTCRDFESIKAWAMGNLTGVAMA